jgi:poly(hydroxyalkanoate) depolymerase family esterase
MRRSQFGGEPPFDWRKSQGGTIPFWAKPELTPRLLETAYFGPNPGALRMLSYAPPGLCSRAPLVVVLHGCGQGAEDYAHAVGWTALAERLGFALLTPEQNLSNNANGCFNWFQQNDTRRGHGEAASIHQMIERTVTALGTDYSRIYITGLSAGGAMTSVMLATYPETFAGGAIIAGLPYGAAGNVQDALASMRQPPGRSGRGWGDLVRKASTHCGPWPAISVWHGSADNTVNPANAEAIIEQWIDVHGIAQVPSIQDEVDGYSRRVWRTTHGRSVLESYTITGMPHGSPISSGRSQDQCGSVRPFVLEAGISSSYRIAEFWGLTQNKASATNYAPGSPPIPEGETPGDRGDEHPKGRPTQMAARIQHVIAKALKAAGLLK